MDDAAAVRRAAKDAVRDIEPDRLRADIVSRIDDMVASPGVLTVMSANGSTDVDGLVELAAGVQLVYEGLQLTRRLAHDEPWRRGSDQEGDFAILVADVLVSRGFFLLSRTAAADRAVSMVQAFGRDQTRRLANDAPEGPAYALEVDAIELAVLTGQAVAGQPLPDARAFARELVEEHDGCLPPVGAVTSDRSRNRLGGLLTGGEVPVE